MNIKYEDIDARTRLYFVFLSYFWLDKNFQGLAAASFDKFVALSPFLWHHADVFDGESFVKSLSSNVS